MTDPRVILPGIPGEIQRELLRLRASSLPGVGYRVKQGRYQVVDMTHPKVNGRTRTVVKPLSSWIALAQVLAWLRSTT